jgi:hypothetical protein
MKTIIPQEVIGGKYGNIDYILQQSPHSPVVGSPRLLDH